MDIKELKLEIQREIANFSSKGANLTKESLREKILRIMEHKHHGRDGLKSHESEQIIKAVCDDFLGFGPLQELMDDKEVTEIMVNGVNKVYIEKHGKKILTNVKFENENHLRYLIERMISPTGRRVDESFPYVDFSLDNGSRVNVIIPPVSVGGPSITIRKFLRSIDSVEDLVNLGTIDQRMAQFLVACIKAKINILFSGATGSGKTSTLEVLSSYIDTSERVVTIEDALELNLRQQQVVRLLTKAPNIENKGEITLRDLFRNSLRMRPTRIILGEIRGEEAMDYLQALNSGHRGCLAVIHAARPSEAISRLETMATYAGLNIPLWGIRRQVSSGLNLIVQLEQLPDGSRKVMYITEVGEFKEDNIYIQDIFRYEVEEVDDNNKVKGIFKSFGKPRFYSIFKKKGVAIDDSIFVPDGNEQERGYWVK